MAITGDWSRKGPKYAQNYRPIQQRLADQLARAAGNAPGAIGMGGGGGGLGQLVRQSGMYGNTQPSLGAGGLNPMTAGVGMGGPTSTYRSGMNPNPMRAIGPGSMAQQTLPLLDDAARLAGGLGGVAPLADDAVKKGLLSRLGGKLGIASASGGLTGNKALLGKAGLAGGAGMGASALSNAIIGEHGDSTWDEAATMAAAGAAMGSFVPGVGTLLGAGVGAGLGGLIGYFGPKGDATGSKAVASAVASNSATLQEQLGSIGLTPENTALITSQFQAMVPTLKSRNQVNDLMASVLQQAPQFLMQQQEDAKADERRMALQSMATSMMNPYLANMSSSAQRYGDVLNSYADSFQQGGGNPEVAALMRSGAASQQLGTDSLAADYQNQLAMQLQTLG